MVKVSVKMLETRTGSSDGIKVDSYSKDETYDMPLDLAHSFVKVQGVAVYTGPETADAGEEVLEEAEVEQKDAGGAPEDKSEVGAPENKKEIKDMQKQEMVSELFHDFGFNPPDDWNKSELARELRKRRKVEEG